jgi:hypothetical protein
MTFMHKVYIQQNFTIDGVDIYIVQTGGGKAFLLSSDSRTLTEVGEGVSPTTPTVRLPESAARALLDQLLQYFQGATDLHTVRSDLLHEREQRDKLTAAITRIAEAK